MPMLEIEHIRKSFGEMEVLRDVSLSVEKGDVVAILGPSGSGKTTLLRCANFLETADSGVLRFDGESFELGRMNRRDIARLRRKTAFVFQNYNLFRNKTALQNVTEGLIVARRVPRALAADPEIIYFDEPTSALDPELTGEVLAVMQQLAQEGRTMLVVTHEMGFARSVASKVVFMEGGVVVEEAPAGPFFAHPVQERTRAFLRRVEHPGL